MGQIAAIFRLSGNTPDSMDLLKKDDSTWTMHFTPSLRNLVGIFPDLLVLVLPRDIPGDPKCSPDMINTTLDNGRSLRQLIIGVSLFLAC